MEVKRNKMRWCFLMGLRDAFWSLRYAPLERNMLNLLLWGDSKPA